MANPKVQEMIDLAACDIRRLAGARSCAAAREAWVAFLEHANRAINRLEGHSRRTNQTPLYKKLLKEEIWANDLTKYMRAVRNVHEHGVEDTEADDPFNERIVFPDGQVIGAPRVYGQTASGEMVAASVQAAPMEWIGSPGVRKISLRPSVQMVPIKSNTGETIMPPHVRIAADDEPEVVAAARLYLEWIITKVGTFA